MHYAMSNAGDQFPLRLDETRKSDYNLFNPRFAPPAFAAVLPGALAFVAGFNTFFSPPTAPTEAVAGVTGLCSCCACACKGAGLFEAAVSVVVVVVVDDDVFDEVEFGGREWLGREGTWDRLRPEMGTGVGDLVFVERNSGGGIYR